MATYDQADRVKDLAEAAWMIAGNNHYLVGFAEDANFLPEDIQLAYEFLLEKEKGIRCKPMLAWLKAHALKKVCMAIDNLNQLCYARFGHHLVRKD